MNEARESSRRKTTPETVGAMDMWLAGLRSGLATIRAEPALGLKRLLLPSSYWRTVEFTYVFNQLAPVSGGKTFDLGSPKDLAIFLARERGLEVVATDLLPEAVGICQKFATAAGIAGSGPGRVLSRVEDGRSLSLESNSMDAVFSVSVIEHVPDDGDTAVMKEFCRIVRPGGRIIVTTAYDLQYREVFVDGPVYDRAPVADEMIFFERRYDENSLAERLLNVHGTRVIDLQLWGERTPLRGQKLLDALGPMRAIVSPFEASLASLCLRRVGPKNRVRPMAAFFTLEKI